MSSSSPISLRMVADENGSSCPLGQCLGADRLSRADVIADNGFEYLLLRSESSTEADSFLSVVSTPSPRVLNLIYHHIRAKSSAVCEQFMK